MTDSLFSTPDSKGRVVLPESRWRSRDPRDKGLIATVISHSGEGGFITIRRFRTTRVRWDRFFRDYEPVDE